MIALELQAYVDQEVKQRVHEMCAISLDVVEYA